MTTTQERIKQAIDATAAQISPDSIPPLRIDALHIEPSRLARRRRGSWRWQRLLVPLTAAASVAAVLVAVSVVAALSGPKAPHHHAARQDGWPPPLSAGTSDAVPRYYAALAYTAHTSSRFHVAIWATATGKRLATISPPTPGDTFSAVLAAADDRTFVLGENQSYSQNGLPHIPVQFYVLRFDPARKSLRLTRLPVRLPSEEQVQGLALSPDGTKLAVAIGGTIIRVFSIRTGATRTWSASGPNVQNVWMEDLTWTADSRYLAFIAMNWQVRPWGLNLLDTAKAGQNLLADSRLLLPFGQDRTDTPQCADSALLAPDGKTIACALIRYPPGTLPAGQRDGYADFSALTGKLLRHFGTRDNRGQSPDLLWISPRGVNLIAQQVGFYGRPIVIGPRNTRTLPWPRGIGPGPDTMFTNMVAW